MGRQNGFTLIEIVIVLTIMMLLAAIIIPSVTGYISRGREQSWEADKQMMTAAVNAWRTDINKRAGNQWPTADNRTIGMPTFTDNTILDEPNGIINIGLLADEYIESANAVKSANTVYHVTANNTPSGSYVWYIETNKKVHSLYWDGDSWETDYQKDVYP